MTIADETAESLFVGLDEEMQKLHNIRTYEAVHFLVRAYHNTYHYPQIIDLFICNSLVGHIGWRGRESRGHIATPFIADVAGKQNIHLPGQSKQLQFHSYVFNYIPFWSCSMEIMKSDILKRMATMIMAMMRLGISQCLLG